MLVMMKRDELAMALDRIKGFAHEASTLPMLQCALIDVRQTPVTICCTDLDTWAKVPVNEAEYEYQGDDTTIAIDAAQLSQIINGLSGDEVMIERNGRKVSVTSGDDSFELTQGSYNDYPEWPAFIDPESTAVVEQSDLKRALHDVVFAMPKADPRKVLLGVQFEIKKDRLTCVATDGRKLGLCEMRVLEFTGAESFSGYRTTFTSEFGAANTVYVQGGVIVTKDFAISLVDLLGEHGQVEIVKSGWQVIFNFDGQSFISKAVDGLYPNYEAVIPKTFKTAVTIESAALLRKLKLAQIVAEKRHHSVLLEVAAGQIIARSGCCDEKFSTIIETNYAGEPFKIAFNHNYLAEMLNLHPRLELQFKDSNAPAIMRFGDQPESMCLLMPLRLADVECRDDEE